MRAPQASRVSPVAGRAEEEALGWGARGGGPAGTEEAQPREVESTSLTLRHLRTLPHVLSHSVPAVPIIRPF